MNTIAKAITDKITILSATAARMDSYPDDYHQGLCLGLRSGVDSLREILESLEGRDLA